MTTLRSSTCPEVGEVLGPHVLLGCQPESGDRLLVPARRLRSPPPSPARATGTRSRVIARSVAAFAPSNSGSSGDRGSVPVVEMENRSARTAGATTTKPDPHEPCVKRAFNSAATQPATARPGPSRFHRRAIVGAPRAAGPRDLSDAQLPFDHPPRRRRGFDPDPAHVSARAGRVHRRPGARRRGGASEVRRGARSTSSCST